MIKLISPSAHFKSSYEQALQEFAEENRNLEYRCPKKGEEFEDFTRRIQKMRIGEGLPEEYVPESVMWLIDGSEFIGEASIRHELNKFLLQVGGHIGYVIRPTKRQQGYGKQILKLSLEETKKMGIKQVLLTCDETNVGSYKIIEANGGILENAVEMGKGQPRKLRYWINLV